MEARKKICTGMKNTDDDHAEKALGHFGLLDLVLDCGRGRLRTLVLSGFILRCIIRIPSRARFFCPKTQYLCGFSGFLMPLKGVGRLLYRLFSVFALKCFLLTDSPSVIVMVVRHISLFSSKK